VSAARGPGGQAAWLEGLAARLSAPAGEAPYWSDGEARVCRSLALAALRQRDLGKLEQVGVAFGGFPTRRCGKDESDLLWEAAGDPQAFGFGLILESMQSAELSDWAREAKPGETERWALGAWLRSGLVAPAFLEARVEYDNVGALRHALSVVGRSSSCPLAAAFGRDCPQALALILSDPDRMSALADLEPQGSMGDQKGLGIKNARERSLACGARMEQTLIWQALACGATRCASMLVWTTQFAAGLEAGRLGWSIMGNFQMTFEDMEDDPSRKRLEGKPATSGALLVDWVVRELTRLQTRRERPDYVQGLWSWLREAAAAAPEGVKKAPLDGSGGWPAACLGALSGGQGAGQEQRRVQQVREWVEFYASQGFEIDAGACAKACEKTAPEAAEWILLRDALSAERPRRSGPKAL
jgi:hypothetical protein